MNVVHCSTLVSQILGQVIIILTELCHSILNRTWRKLFWYADCDSFKMEMSMLLSVCIFKQGCDIISSQTAIYNIIMTWPRIWLTSVLQCTTFILTAVLKPYGKLITTLSPNENKITEIYWLYKLTLKIRFHHKHHGDLICRLWQF
jgi:hypothetical protein